MNLAQQDDWDDRSFQILRDANMARLMQSYTSIVDLPISDLTCEFCSAAGLVANTTMRSRIAMQDPEHLRIAMGLNIGNTVVVGDLLAAKYDLNLAECIKESFNAYSAARGSNIKL